MLKRIKNLLKRPSIKQAHVIPVQEHGIDLQKISSSALITVEQLRNKGYSAYIVGGAIRDLLLGKTPKDFDVVTDATPEEIKKIFSKAFIIGKRFRLVHVLHGDDLVEVSTFRGQDNSQHYVLSQEGRILRDNVFGTQHEDADRRDFTINAFYYDPIRQEILDFHHGIEDIRSLTLRVIGDPEIRYREDPVRMLRAIRLAAKLDLQFDKKSQKLIPQNINLLKVIPDSRLFEEMCKIFLSGYAQETIDRLRETQLHPDTLPLLDILLAEQTKFMAIVLENTDHRVRNHHAVSIGFFLAALFWHKLCTTKENYESQGLKPHPALHSAEHDLLEVQADKMMINRRLRAYMREIWRIQLRIENRRGKHPLRLVHSQYFRAGLDFLSLRNANQEVSNELMTWWNDFFHADNEVRQNMLNGRGKGKKKMSS